EPYEDNGTRIGDNILSQWLGSHDGYGSTDHFDLVLRDSGSASGDYLYTAYVPRVAASGLWGLFRVGNVPTPAIVNLPQCQPAGVPPAAAPVPPGQTNPKNLDRFRQQPGFEPPAPSRPVSSARTTGQATKKTGDSTALAGQSTQNKNP